jgi:3'(2'), 5'-bisphosphate nucleotidase
MHDRELEAALEAARLAGSALCDAYQRFQAIPDAPSSISTEADRQSQEIILGYLHRAFPADALCAEEATPTLAAAPQTGQRLWIVDPIDGTRGFARKNAEFSVMIAFVHDNQPAVGVVLEPAKGRLTFAARGQGCWRRDGSAAAASACRVSTVANLAEATLTQSHSRNPGTRSRLVEALNPARVVETYSAGIKLALVARGEADLYLNTYEAFHDWDICAGHVLVAEAGGTVTGIGGQELHYGLSGAWQRHGLLASNARLHDAAVAALGRG